MVNYLKMDKKEISDLINKTINNLGEASKSIISKSKNISGNLEYFSNIKPISATKEITKTSYDKLILSYIKYPYFIFMIVFLFMYSQYFAVFNDLVKTNVKLLLDFIPSYPVFRDWYVSVLTIVILANVYNYLLVPFENIETKEKLLKKSLNIFIIWGFLFLFLSGLWYDSGYTLEETSMIGVNKTQSWFSSAFKTFTCAMDTNCINKKLNSKNSQVSKRVEYDYNLKLIKPTISGLTRTLDQLKKKPLKLIYDISNKKELEIKKIECYIQDSNFLDNNRKFYEKDLNINLQTKEIRDSLDDLKCDFSNLDYINKKQKDEVTIIVKLTTKVKTMTTLHIPFINQEEFLKTNDFQYNLNDGDTILNKYVSKAKKPFKIETSNNLINAKIENSNYLFPIVLGENQDNDIQLNIDFSFSNDKTLGDVLTFENIGIVNIPSSLSLVDDNLIFEQNNENKNEYNLLLDFEKNNFNYNNNGEILFVENLDFETSTIFIKSNRFKFWIKDINFKESNKEKTIEKVTSDDNSENNKETNNNEIKKEIASDKTTQEEPSNEKTINEDIYNP